MDSKYWTKKRLNLRYSQWSSRRINDLRAKVIKSQWRLGYHIQPETGLLNDPNGFSYYNHQWHLFYQTFPFGAVHGLKSWTHLVSNDLIHWRNVHVPMIPDNQYDRNGCYSGSAIVVGLRLFIMYTGNVWNEKEQRISYQNGAWLDSDNQIHKLRRPLIKKSPQHVTGNFRDPQVIKHGDWYYAILGAQTDQMRGQIVVYISHHVDRGWERFGTLDVGNYNLGKMVECPNLIFVDHHPVVIFCIQNSVKKFHRTLNSYVNVYVAGDNLNWKQMKIVNPTKMRRLDDGFDLYATQGLNAPDGRALAISWVGYPNAKYPSDVEGWSGALSLVNNLRIQNGYLIQYPVREVQRLFQKELKAVNGMEIPQQVYVEWSPVKSRSSQIAITAETSHLYFETDSALDRLAVHRQNDRGPDEVRTVHLNLHRVKNCQLYFDNSEFELYINHGLKTVTGRFFRDGSTLNLNWTDCGQVKVRQMKKING